MLFDLHPSHDDDNDGLCRPVRTLRLECNDIRVSLNHHRKICEGENYALHPSAAHALQTIIRSTRTIGDTQSCWVICRMFRVYIGFWYWLVGNEQGREDTNFLERCV